MRSRRGPAVLLTAAACAAALAGCAASAAQPPSSRLPSAAGSSTAPALATAPTTATLSSGGVTLTVTGSAALAAQDGALDPVSTGDDSARLTVTSRTEPTPDGPRQTLATITGPSGTTLQVLPDGSFLVLGADGSPAAGVTVSSGSALAGPDGDVLLAGWSGAALWLSSRAVDSATWGHHEGGRSLAVAPTPWGRSGSQAAERLLWAQISADQSAAGQTMRDQLDCHLLGAPDKPTWNLEPWRPVVSSVEMIASGCNPT